MQLGVIDAKSGGVKAPGNHQLLHKKEFIIGHENHHANEKCTCGVEHLHREHEDDGSNNLLERQSDEENGPQDRDQALQHTPNKARKETVLMKKDSTFSVAPTGQ